MVKHTVDLNGLAVVVPAYRPELGADELLSLRHLEHYLPGAARFLAMPEALDFGRRDYRVVHFPSACFASLAAYNQLMLSKQFYSVFDDYEFVLIHQLDAIVLTANIERFLRMGVDYVGAPFVEYDRNGAPYLLGVGNGGLSLRRVSAFRRLLESRVRTTTPRKYYRERYSSSPLGCRVVGLSKATAKGLGMRNSIRREIRVSLGNEDLFIANEARKYSPRFSVADIEQALSFAFEREPRFCYERAGGRMPMGAHAWPRYDRSFWEPYLLS